MPLGLDENCGKILATLCVGKLQFNELYKLLEKEMSKPTLSLHLKHLVEGRFVVRKVEDVQKVSYRLNMGRFQNFESFKENKEKLEKFMNQTFVELGLHPLDFNSLDWEEKLAQVWLSIFKRSLFTLKAQINFEVSPSWQNEMLFSLFKGSSGLEKGLIELCKNDKQFRERVLKRIDELIFNFDEPLLPFNK